MNTFGKNLRTTTFGESHGPAIGGVIDGFPAGFKINFERLQEELDKRKPGTNLIVSQRKESDRPEFLSGISSEGVTLGTPIGFIIRNEDQRSKDYSNISSAFRPNHADFTYQAKYGIRDFRGGGRASARETANWVVAGALANQWLESRNIHVESLLTRVGSLNFTSEIKKGLVFNPLSEDIFQVSSDIQDKFSQEIQKAKESGDSLSGEVSCLITGVPVGIGGPVFNKLHASLAQAMMSINAAKAFEYGIGNDTFDYTGIEQLDYFYPDSEGKIMTETNFSGGIQGGISNGMPIFFSVAFKPTPTILREISTIDENGKSLTLQLKGRHDPCVAVRAVAVVKAMAALVIADNLLYDL